MGIAYAFSTDRKAHPGRHGALAGWPSSSCSALFVLKTQLGQDVFSWLGAKVTRVARLVLRRLRVPCVGKARRGPTRGLDPGPAGRSGSSSRSACCPRSSSWPPPLPSSTTSGSCRWSCRPRPGSCSRRIGASRARDASTWRRRSSWDRPRPRSPIRPFLNEMTQSELMCDHDRAASPTVSGRDHGRPTSLMLQDVFPNVADHLLAASVMTARAEPAGLEDHSSRERRPEDQGLVADRGREARRQRHRGRRPRLLQRCAARPQRRRHAHGLHLPRRRREPRRGHPGRALRIRVESRCERSSAPCFAPLALAMGVPWKDTGYVGGLLGTRRSP